MADQMSIAGIGDVKDTTIYPKEASKETEEATPKKGKKKKG